MTLNIGQRTISASGGTISTIFGHTVHTFTSSGNFIPRGNGTIEVLVVGGGGDNEEGGGGGGNVVYNKFVNVTSGTSYPITIGAVGGPGSVGGATSCSFNNIVISAFGGGGGGSSPGGVGISSLGASGGGGGISSPGGFGIGVTGLGFSGGTGDVSVGGGGGGAGAVGTPGSLNGNGGIGVSYSITGVSSYYGAGGGGFPSGNPNGGLSSLASFGAGNTPGVVIIRYPS